MINKIKKTISNPMVIYIINKYAIFGISFLNSMLFAVKLGAFYLGVWGFINLILSYFSHASLGVPNSINVLISKNKSKSDYTQEIFYNALGIMVIICLSITLFLFVLYLFDIPFGEKYNFRKYLLPSIVIIITTLLNSLMSTALRIYNKVNIISFTQSIYPILGLIAAITLSGDKLITALVYILLISQLLTAFVYAKQIPFKINIKYKWDYARVIGGKAIFLFIYAASFYFIMLSTKGLISTNYDVVEFGFFTFSFSFANAAMLFMKSVSFLIFPKAIKLLANDNKNIVSNTIKKLRSNYIVLTHFVVHISILLFPLFLIFFPEYQAAGTSFKLIALTLIMYTNSFGYQTMLVAKDKEKLIAKYSFFALLINIIFVYILIKIVQVPFSFVILATMLTYTVYVYFITRLGRITLNIKYDFWSTLKDSNPLSISIPFLVSLILTLFQLSNWFYIIPVILLLFLNLNELFEIYKTGKKVAQNPNFLNI